MEPVKDIEDWSDNVHVSLKEGKFLLRKTVLYF